MDNRCPLQQFHKLTNFLNTLRDHRTRCSVTQTFDHVSNVYQACLKVMGLQFKDNLGFWMFFMSITRENNSLTSIFKTAVKNN